jgi:hypothetical protein
MGEDAGGAGGLTWLSENGALTPDAGHAGRWVDGEQSDSRWLRLGRELLVGAQTGVSVPREATAAEFTLATIIRAGYECDDG